MQYLAESNDFQHSSAMVLSKSEGLNSGPVSMIVLIFSFSVITPVWICPFLWCVIPVSFIYEEIVLVPFPS